MEFPRFSSEKGKTNSSEKSTSDKKERSVRFPVGVAMEKTPPPESPRPNAEAHHSRFILPEELLPRPSETPEDGKTKKKKRKKAKATAAADTPQTETVTPNLKVNQQVPDNLVGVRAAAESRQNASVETDTRNPEASSEEARRRAYQEFIEQTAQPRNSAGGGDVIVYQRGDATAEAAELEIPHGETPRPKTQPDAVPGLPYRAVAEQAGWRSQPEIQHQARGEADTAEPAPPRAAGAGGGNIPPQDPPEAYTGAAADFPEPYNTPEAAYLASRPLEAPLDPAATPETLHPYVSNIAPPPVRTVVAGSERLVPERDVERAVREAKKSGLGTGLLIGGAVAYYEHRKHKKREKVLKKQHKETNKRLEDVETSSRFRDEEQTRKLDVTESRMRAAERRLAEIGQSSRPAPERVTPATATASAERTPRVSASTVNANRLPNITGTQQERMQPERGGVSVGSEKLNQKPKARNPEQVVAGDTPITVPKDEYLVQSGSSFTEQINRRTGKVSENPSFEHGHEYDNEKAQEKLSAAAQQRNTAAGEVALVAAAMSQSRNVEQRSSTASVSENGGGNQGGNGGGAASPASLPSPSSVPDASTQGPPPARDRSPQQTTAAAGSGQRTREQPLWPWVVALAVIIICLIALLR